MKLSYAALVLSAFQVYTCNAQNGTALSTVVCPGCPSTTASVVDIVTRSSEPTTSCSAAALTAVYATSNGTSKGSPSGPGATTTLSTKGTASTTAGTTTGTTTPITVNSANKMVGGMGGMVALVLAAAYVV